jgi:hypothetical protein
LNISPDLREILGRCWAQDPSSRPNIRHCITLIESVLPRPKPFIHQRRPPKSGMQQFSASSSRPPAMVIKDYADQVQAVMFLPNDSLSTPALFPGRQIKQIWDRPGAGETGYFGSSDRLYQPSQFLSSGPGGGKYNSVSIPLASGGPPPAPSAMSNRRRKLHLQLDGKTRQTPVRSDADGLLPPLPEKLSQEDYAVGGQSRSSSMNKASLSLLGR